MSCVLSCSSDFFSFFHVLISLELVVAESVVVIKKLLQTHQGSHGDIVGQMARLVNRITVPQARAAILWLVGEHCEKKRVSKMAPDVLRLMAKSFSNEV